MAKYIIKQRLTSYAYVTVEANSRREAMNHIPTIGDAIITSSGYFENLEVKEFNSGDLICTNTPSGGKLLTCKPINKGRTKQKADKKFEYGTCFDVIDESKIRTVKSRK